MTLDPMTFDEIGHAVEAAGLTLRGGFHPNQADGVPATDAGQVARTLVMLGNAGPAMWRAFSRERDPETDLLDDWSADVIGKLAGDLGATACYPFDKPPLPFQRWAQRAEPCQPSPLGIFIHPNYGLWHGYRGALIFAEQIALPVAVEAEHPCETCADQPCLSTCPVAAFSPGNYDVPACARHLAAPEGKDCLEEGCRARRACPVGQAFRYQPAQAHFHMRAFLRARRAQGLV